MQPGTVVLGTYRLGRTLGRGGMGMVSLAHHLQLEQPVAIKLLHPHVSADAGVVRRFLREAQAAARLRGEHVARIMDVGTLEDGAPYIVMEYLEGSDLAGVVRAGPLAPGRAVELILQACEALAEAHAQGIVHRDLKPSNLFLTHRADGTPLLKVLDFGISKTGGAADSDEPPLLDAGDLVDTAAAAGAPAAAAAIADDAAPTEITDPPHPPEDGPDRPPQVEYVSPPPDGATDVDAETWLQVFFSESMDRGTIINIGGSGGRGRW